MEKKITVSVQIDPKTKEQIERECAKMMLTEGQKISTSKWIRLAVEQVLKEQQDS